LRLRESIDFRMCLIAWKWQPDALTPLLLIANRDEYYARATEPLQWWDGDVMLAGKDLEAGGTWLGVTRTGRLAALTNFRDPANVRVNTPSRGELVARFLQCGLDSRAFLAQLALRAEHYNPFNLLVFDGHHLMGLESRNARVLEMQPGLGAVSNADFYTPWPKLSRLSQGLEAHLGQSDSQDAALWDLLADRSVATDDTLPDTGIARERERVLSAAFIQTPDYGTRACSIVRLGTQVASFTERGFDAKGQLGTQCHAFNLI
jgi:uncharacterized protein with NRDE domain